MRAEPALAWSALDSLCVRLTVTLTVAAALPLVGISLSNGGYEPAAKTMLLFLVTVAVASWLLAGMLVPAPSQSLQRTVELVATASRQAALKSSGSTSQATTDENEVLAHWVAALERRTRSITVLNELVGLLHGCLTREAVYQAVSLTMPRLFPGSSGLLYIAGPGTCLQVEATWGDCLGPPNLEMAHCYALQLGLPYILESETGRPICPHAEHSSAESSMCIPMTVSSLPHVALLEAAAPIGLLYVAGAWAAREHEDLRQTTRDLVLATAQHLALAFTNLHLQERLLYQATTDPLTRLYNRRYLADALERELSRAARSDESLSVVMLDLDYFKRFNDTFGHLQGDRLLAAVGEFLMAATRREDIACRYGGEEFVVVMPHTDMVDAQGWADQLRHALKSLDLGRACGTPVTCSAGVAAFPDHGLTGDSVLRAADEALYAAKRDGRDRVAVAGAPGGTRALLRLRPKPGAKFSQRQAV